jgi:hypothetical protein
MSVPVKRARFLLPNRIADLVWNSESEEAEASGDSVSEDEGGCQDQPGVSPEMFQ